MVASILSNQAEAEAPADTFEVEKSEPSIETLIASYDWDYDTALAVAKAESGLNPEAINDNPATKDYSIGLFQINLYGELAEGRPSKEWLLIPENNVDYAFSLYKNYGFTPWSVCYNGKVKCW